MSTVYVEQITALRNSVIEYRKKADLSDQNHQKLLSRLFSDIFRDMHSVEEKDLINWVKGTAGTILYYGGLYDQNSKEYEKVLDEIIDRLEQELK